MHARRGDDRLPIAFIRYSPSHYYTLGLDNEHSVATLNLLISPLVPKVTKSKSLDIDDKKAEKHLLSPTADD